MIDLVLSFIGGNLDWLLALVPAGGTIWAAVKGSWRLTLAAGAVLAVMIAWLWISGLRHDLALATIAAEDARRQQAETAAALETLRRAKAADQAALAAAEQAREEAEAHADTLRRKIAAAPRSRACVDAPAIRGLLDALRATASGDNP